MGDHFPDIDMNRHVLHLMVNEMPAHNITVALLDLRCYSPIPSIYASNNTLQTKTQKCLHNIGLGRQCSYIILGGCCYRVLPLG